MFAYFYRETCVAEQLTRRPLDLDEHGSSLAHRVVSLEITCKIQAVLRQMKSGLKLNKSPNLGAYFLPLILNQLPFSRGV